MASTAEDIHELVAKMRYNLSALQAQVTDLYAMLQAANLKDAPKYPCPVCGVPRPTQEALRDHLLLVHDQRPAPDLPPPGNLPVATKVKGL